MDMILACALEVLDYIKNNWTFSGIASVCAISLTTYGLWATRRHSRLSVRPFLTDQNHSDNGDTHYTESFEIINNGLGPALIKKFEVRKDGVPMVWKDQDDLQDQIQKFLPYGQIKHISIFKPGHAVATLLGLIFDYEPGVHPSRRRKERGVVAVWEPGLLAPTKKVILQEMTLDNEYVRYLHDKELEKLNTHEKEE